MSSLQNTVNYSLDPDFWKPDEPGRMVQAPTRNTLVLPELPKQAAIAYPINDSQAALTTGLMARADTIHTADPVSRGMALLLKMGAATLFLWGLTLAGLVLLGSLGFFLWLFLASLEGLLCFIFLAYNDWREHPSAVRWLWSVRMLGMMEREHAIRMYKQYGYYDIKGLKEDERNRRAAQLPSNR